MAKAVCLVLWLALAAASPASAQFLLQEHSTYPAGVGDQFPPGATSVSNALAYSFQVQNLSGVPTAVNQVTLQLTLTGIAAGDISSLVLQSDPGALVTNGSVVGNTLVFGPLVSHSVPGLSTRRFVARWNVANLAASDSAVVDVVRTDIVPNPTSGDAAPVTHLVELAIPTLGVTARLALAAALCGIAATLAARVRSRAA